jgi:hypothetical protein
MPFSPEALGIVFVVAFFGVALAILVDFYPVFKKFIDTLVEGIKDLKKFKRKKPF